MFSIFKREIKSAITSKLAKVETPTDKLDEAISLAKSKLEQQKTQLKRIEDEKTKIIQSAQSKEDKIKSKSSALLKKQQSLTTLFTANMKLKDEVLARQEEVISTTQNLAERIAQKEAELLQAQEACEKSAADIIDQLNNI